MRKLRFAEIAISFFFVLFWHPAQSYAQLAFSSHVQVRLLTPVAGKSTTVSIDYLKSCASEFHSVVIQEFDKEVQFGVMLKDEATICTALPQLHTVTIAQLRLPQNKVIRPIKAVVGKGHFQIAPSLRVADAGGDRALYFQSVCADFMGLLLQAGGEGKPAQLKLGALQYLGKEQNKAAEAKGCVAKAEFAPLSLLGNFPSNRLTMMNPVPSSPARPGLDGILYSLLPVAFVKDSERQTELEIRLACGQQLVGLALRQSVAGSRQIAALAVQPARGSCGQSEQKIRLDLSGFRWAAGPAWESVPASRNLKGWRLVSPTLKVQTGSDPLTAASEAGVAYSALRSAERDCAASATGDAYQVIAVDGFDGLAVGFLAQTASAACYERLGSLNTQESLFLSPETREEAIVPLRVATHP